MIRSSSQNYFFFFNYYVSHISFTGRYYCHFDTTFFFRNTVPFYSISPSTPPQINYDHYFVGKIYFVYVHLRLFCVRLVRCVLDATGMLPSVDDVYVHCGPPPSTIWGMTINVSVFASFFKFHYSSLFAFRLSRSLKSAKMKFYSISSIRKRISCKFLCIIT